MCLKTAQEAGRRSQYGAGRKGKLIRTESMSVVSVKSVQVSKAGGEGQGAQTERSSDCSFT